MYIFFQGHDNRIHFIPNALLIYPIYYNSHCLHSVAHTLVLWHSNQPRGSMVGYSSRHGQLPNQSRGRSRISGLWVCSVWGQGVSFNRVVDRVFVYISKMHLWNSNHTISAYPDLVTQLLQILTPTTFGSLLHAISAHLLHILIPTTFSSLVVSKRAKYTWLCPRRWFVMKRFGH